MEPVLSEYDAVCATVKNQYASEHTRSVLDHNALLSSYSRSLYYVPFWLFFWIPFLLVLELILWWSIPLWMLHLTEWIYHTVLGGPAVLPDNIFPLIKYGWIAFNLFWTIWPVLIIIALSTNLWRKAWIPFKLYWYYTRPEKKAAKQKAREELKRQQEERRKKETTALVEKPMETAEEIITQLVQQPVDIGPVPMPIKKKKWYMFWRKT
jgi:hypothetical protein